MEKENSELFDKFSQGCPWRHGIGFFAGKEEFICDAIVHPPCSEESCAPWHFLCKERELVG